MPKAHGTYTAKRDAQTYAYEVTWRGGDQSIVWDAKVRLNNQLVAVPIGQVVPSQGLDPAAVVKQEIESAIEHRLSAD
jgi:hypothetical protein